MFYHNEKFHAIWVSGDIFMQTECNCIILDIMHICNKHMKTYYQEKKSHLILYMMCALHCHQFLIILKSRIQKYIIHTPSRKTSFTG